MLILDEVPFATTCWLGLVERLAGAPRHSSGGPEERTTVCRVAARFHRRNGSSADDARRDRRFMFLSIEFALLEPERIENLVLVPAGAPTRLA